MKLTDEKIFEVIESLGAHYYSSETDQPNLRDVPAWQILDFASAILKEAGMEELERDAERYRWLCNQTYGCDPEPFRLLDDFDSDKESISIAIDKAMKAK